MKKLIALLLILIFIFNMGAYYLWLNYKDSQVEAITQISLDKSQYNNNELIKITFPLSDAYQNDWSEYKRVDGQISFEGKIYTYVKEKVEGGQLILLCIPDHQKMQAQINKENLAKNLLDVPTSKKQNNSKALSKVIGLDFAIFSNCSNKNYLHQSISNTFYILNINIIRKANSSPEQPPELSGC